MMSIESILDAVFASCEDLPRHGNHTLVQALRVADGSARYAPSRGRMGRNRRPKQLGANRRLANA